MARKKKHEEHENHERWLVSYADFITLLFAFFVVMYALSSVNEGKFRVLSDALISAFNSPPKIIEPIQIGTPIKPPQSLIKDIVPPTNAIEPLRPPIRQQVKVDADGTKDIREKNRLNSIATKLETALSKMAARNLIKVHKSESWIEVEINASVLFDSGSALLQPQAIPILTEIARILRDFPNAIRVEGHTDNFPIETTVYPSNWELSAGRAANIVHLFTDERVEPYRMSAVGFGEYRPVAANTTPEGRSRNRRVIVVILSEAADKLYDRGAVVTLKGGEQPVKDIDLDAPLPLLQEITPQGTNNKPIPDGFPSGLPLLNRESVPANGESKTRMNTLLEELTQGQGNSSAAGQNGKGQ